MYLVVSDQIKPVWKQLIQELLKANEEFNAKTGLHLGEQLEKMKEANSKQIPQAVEYESKRIFNAIEELKGKIQIQTKSLENFIYKYELESKMHKIKTYLLEAEIYKLKKVKTTACRSLCEAATLQIEIGHSPNYSLIGILEILSSFTEISSTLISDISKSIKKIPLEHDSLIIKIEEKLNSLEVN